MESAAHMPEKTPEFFGQVTRKGREASWLDTNQRRWLEVVKLSADATRENLRFWVELQSTAIETLSGLATGWVEAQREAVAWYEKALTRGIESMQSAFGTIAEDGSRSGLRGRQRPTELAKAS